jgi:hypothetical protein
VHNNPTQAKRRLEWATQSVVNAERPVSVCSASLEMTTGKVALPFGVVVVVTDVVQMTVLSLSPAKSGVAHSSLLLA